jgi:hypothetical protein
VSVAGLDISQGTEANGRGALSDWPCDWRKIPVDDQHLRPFKMAVMAAILDLVSVDYLTNASVYWSDFFVAYWG